MTSRYIPQSHPSRSRAGNRMELITMTTNGNEPLVKLWIERNRVLALFNAADTEFEFDAAGDKLSAIEGRIANARAETLPGVLVQIKLHGDVLKDSGKWIHTAALTRNVVKALERMEGAAIVGT